MKFLAALLVMGAAIIAGTAAAQVPDTKHSFVEIIPVVVPLTYTGGLAVYFSITEGGRTDRPIIKSSKSFMSKGNDFKGPDPDLVQTPDRQERLQAFIAELKAHGWQLAGQGKHWYSYRFATAPVSSNTGPGTPPTTDEDLNAWLVQQTIRNMSINEDPDLSKKADEMLLHLKPWQ